LCSWQSIIIGMRHPPRSSSLTYSGLLTSLRKSRKILSPALRRIQV
jgi:hypothetical protein